MSSNFEEDSSLKDSSTEDSELEEDELNNDYAAFSAKYMGEITNLLGAHSHVNCENALLLNKEMQQRLQEVRKRLQALLEAVKQRYLSNEQRLKLNLGKKQRGIGMRGAYLKGGTFFFKGNMFFKDLKCRNCPNNEDYEYRKNVEGEMFPMDLELCSRHVWSLVDKKAVVQAVKEQVLNYLADRKLRDKNSGSKNISLQIQVHTEKLTSLLAKVDDAFQIDWEEVSAHNLNYRHSPSSCKTMWQVYLHPSLKRTAWTADENKHLLQAAQMHNYQNWESIAKAIPKRSDYQCFIQYQTSVCYHDTQRWGRWDKRDDAKLLELVRKKTINGVIDWNAVSSYFPHKPKRSLHQRYMYYLDPKISHEPFTPEEDLILLAAVEEYGEKFSIIPRTLFPNRSITQLRMRYNNTLKDRHTLSPWTVEDDRKLMEFVAEHGTSSWLRCAESLGNHTRISCRTRFLTIQKFFKKNPDTTLEDLPRKKTCVLKNSVITKQNWVEKVAELRDNPDTVLVPGVKEKRKKSSKAATEQVKKLKTSKPPKCEIQIPKRRSRKKQPYVERLRAVEQQLYHFFKYAYNFRLGTNVCIKPPNSVLIEVAATLDFQLNPAQAYKHDPLLKFYIGQRCKYYLQQRNQSPTFWPCPTTLAPSWSTAMAFRALCVQSAQVQLTEQEEEEPSEMKAHPALRRFRNRMLALFFQTALLSRLRPGVHLGDIKDSITSAPKTTHTTDTIVTETNAESLVKKTQLFDLSLDSTQTTDTIGTEASAEIVVNNPPQLFDLSLVKNEVLSEFLPSHETATPTVNEVSKKEKTIENVLGASRRKRKLKTSAETAIQNDLASANTQTTENISYRKDDEALLINQSITLQQTDNATANMEHEYHSGSSPPDSDPQSTIECEDTMPLSCLPSTHKSPRKDQLLLPNPKTECAPAAKRICIDMKIDRSELKLTNIKAEYET